MSNEPEQGTPAVPEKRKRGGLVAIILGATLVIAGAAGVVVFTRPDSKAEAEAQVDLDTLPARQWIEKISVTFNPLNSKNSLCKLSFYFEYKCPPAPMVEEQVIVPNLRKAKSRILIFLKGLTKDDIEGSHGAEHVRKQLIELLEESLFPDGGGLVSDVFIEELLFT
ncbi:MAG: hypothetical protein R3F30_10290 [Planctomycetota bacterium]